MKPFKFIFNGGNPPPFSKVDKGKWSYPVGFTPAQMTNWQGFVYKVTHKKSGKYYIGKKTFWNDKKRPPLKGRKNKRHYKKESDWRDYCTSSKKVQELVEKEGENAFRWEILVLCSTRFQCSYEELKLQMKKDVLFDPKAYNEIINVRLRRQGGER